MSARTFILTVTGIAFIVAACGSCDTYGTSVIEVGKTSTPVASVSVTVPPSLAAGQTARAIATLKDANGTVLTDRSVQWFTSSASIASVSDSGIVSGISVGDAVVSAVSEGVPGQATLAVVPPPPPSVATVSVAVRPSAVVVGQTALATATLADSTGTPISGKTVTWESSDITVATVDTAGTVKATGTGNAKIKASSSGKSNSTVLSVTAPAPIPVASVSVSPVNATLQVGGTVQLSAVTYDSASNVLTGRLIGWSSSNSGIATVSSSGLVTAVAGGSATVTASSEGQMASAAITVSPPAVASVSVSPATASLLVGATVQLSATTRDANNNVLTGRAVTWSSSNTGISTVSASGLVTAVAAGTATITATSETKTGTSAITVSAPASVPVASVTVSPSTASLLVGSTAQLSATTRDANNNILTGRIVTWSSSNTGISTVSTSGLVTAVAPGTATITATSETKTGTSAITVSATPVASVTVSPATASVQVGGTVQFSAVTRDANNNVLTGRSITWNSNTPSFATVSASGLATAVTAGTVQITATSEGKTGTASLTVQAQTQPPPVSNEPVGMTFITQRGFDALNEKGWNDQEDTNGGLSIAQDITAPISSSNIGRMTYPTGFVAGSSPANSGVPTGTSYHTLYVRFAAKLSSNWYGQAAGFSKFFYVWEDVNLEGFFFAAHGTGTDPLEPYGMLQGLIAYPPAGPSGSGQNLAPNLVPSARIIRGQWQIYEFILTGNSAGTADGSVDWFLDGVHIGSVRGIKWTTDATVFTHFNWDPVWGGIGPPNVPATQTMDWDHVYLSGKN
jgi:uncharacterized protein YjdB